MVQQMSNRVRLPVVEGRGEILMPEPTDSNMLRALYGANPHNLAEDMGQRLRLIVSG